MTDPNAPQKPTFLQAVVSVLAAFFGVQNSRNRVRDFKHGRASTFIVAGVLMTLVFVLTVVMLVKLVLSQAGAG